MDKDLKIKIVRKALDSTHGECSYICINLKEANEYFTGESHVEDRDWLYENFSDLLKLANNLKDEILNIKGVRCLSNWNDSTFLFNGRSWITEDGRRNGRRFILEKYLEYLLTNKDL